MICTSAKCHSDDEIEEYEMRGAYGSMARMGENRSAQLILVG